MSLSPPVVDCNCLLKKAHKKVGGGGGGSITGTPGGLVATPLKMHFYLLFMLTCYRDGNVHRSVCQITITHPPAALSKEREKH